MRRLDNEILERGSRVDRLIQELENRIKTVENELNEEGEEDGDGEGDVDIEDGHENPLEKNATEVALNLNADEGLVNIGEMKTIAAAFSSEKQLMPNRPTNDVEADPLISGA